MNAVSGPLLRATDGADPVGRFRATKRMMSDYREEIKALVGERVFFDVPMRRFTSLKVGGPADCLIFPRDIDELRKIVLHAERRRIPVFILGKGTNLVVKDKGIRGWVISLTRGINKIECLGEEIDAEAGASLQRVVQSSIRRGLAGMEALSGIPGSVGGALAMNAGAWGVEVKDVLLSITFIDEGGEIVERSRPRLKFSYRKLEYPSSWIILKGRFHLERGRKEQLVDRVQSFLEKRRATQPLDYPNAGSIFKNPKEGPAGRWIEETGLKGFRIGQAMVSDRHANFIVNLGKATGGDVLRLIEWIEMKVYAERGISLDREVKVVGE